MSKQETPPAPQIHQDFIARYPELGQAWELMAESGQKGPLDDRMTRIVKLAVAMGAMREGAVHASVRKARARGISREEIEQCVAIAASTVGLPSSVALYSWVRDVLDAESSASP
jgi:4-carboxymuconolactone decarboxylase